MIYLLYALFILSCIALIASVLLQPGKSDAGALFTSSVSSTAFGPRGTLNVLSKITIGSAAVFMLTAFMLGQSALTGGRSVLESGALPEEPPAATTDANANNSAVADQNAMGANTNADANSATTSNANTAAATGNTSATTNANAGNANAASSPAAKTSTTNQAANR